MKVGNVLLASAILLSGNNFEKVKLMFSFLGLGLMSRPSHFKIQTKHCCPVIEKEFSQMTDKNIEKYIGKEILVIGKLSYKCRHNKTYILFILGSVGQRSRSLWHEM